MAKSSFRKQRRTQVARPLRDAGQACRAPPVQVRPGIDIESGALLALSPWLFEFAGRVFWRHLIVGVMEIGAGLTTRTAPEDATGATGGQAV
jgi:hypothetical protein